MTPHLNLEERHLDALILDDILFENACNQLHELAVGQVPAKVYRATRAGLGALASKISQTIIAIAHHIVRRGLEPQMMRAIPEWERDIEELLMRLRSWQNSADMRLANTGVSIAGPGWNQEPDAFPRPQDRSAILGALAAGRVGGTEPIVAEPQELASTAMSAIQQILNHLGGSPVSKAALRHSQGARHASDFDRLKNELMQELEDIVAKSNEAVYASQQLARMSRSAPDQFDAAVASVITPLDEGTEALEAALNEMINLLGDLNRSIPAHATSWRGKPSRARERSLGYIGREAEAQAQQLRPRR